MTEAQEELLLAVSVALVVLMPKTMQNLTAAIRAAAVKVEQERQTRKRH